MPVGGYWIRPSLLFQQTVVFDQKDFAHLVTSESAQLPRNTSSAALSPERTAPSMLQCQCVAVSVPAQWMRPHGSHNALPKFVSQVPPMLM
jgi:hypothetical protein